MFSGLRVPIPATPVIRSRRGTVVCSDRFKEVARWNGDEIRNNLEAPANSADPVASERACR